MAYRPRSFIGLPFVVIAIVVLILIAMRNMGYFRGGL